MKKVLINLILLGTLLFAQEGVVIDTKSIVKGITKGINVLADINLTMDFNLTMDINITENNTTIEDLNDTKEDTNETQNDRKHRSDENNSSEENNATIKIRSQMKPIILHSNIAAKKNEIIVKGKATKNLDIEIIFIQNKNERIIINTKSNENGDWYIFKAAIIKRLDDGIYNIFVSSKDKLGNKSQIASKKNLLKDTLINGTIEILEGSLITSPDKIINIKELQTFYISGKIDLDAKIDKIFIFNTNDEKNKINIDPKKIKIDKNGNFKIVNKHINLNKLEDGELVVKLIAQDQHKNILSIQNKISKDTTPPALPIILTRVKNDNMIYGRVPNLLVCSGSAEVDSKIEATLFNIKYPKLKTIAKTTTPASSQWTFSGKDFDIGNLKDGTIKSILIQIDKAGNRSKALVNITKKERPLIFQKKIVLIPPEDYMPIFTIKDVTDKVKSIIVSDKYIIAGSFEFLYYFDKAKGKLKKQIEVKNQWVNSILLDGDKLIIALSSGNIEIRDLQSAKLIKRIKASNMPILSLLLDKKTNNLVSSSSNGDISIWDLKNYKEIHSLKKHQWDVFSIAIDNDKLFTGSDDYSIKMWDIKSGKLLKNLKSAHGGSINSLLVYKNMLISASDDKLIYVRDIESGKLLHILDGHKRGVTSLKINHDYLVSASNDRTLILWDLHTFNKIKQLRGHSKSILSMDINKENIVTGSMDYKIRVWGYDESLQGQGDIDETVLAKYDLIRSLNISNDIVTALGQTESELVFSTKGYIFFYNNITYKFTRSYSTLDKVFAVANKKSKKEEKSDDDWGEEESSDEESKDNDDGWADEESSDDEQSGWEEDLEDKKEQRALAAKTNLQWINDINIQGTVVTAALGFRDIKIWELERNKAIALLEGHENSVLNVIRHDGTIITSSSDGTIKIWDEESNTLTLSIEAHQWDIKTIVIDGDKLYSGSDDYSIKIWDIETGELIKTIKSAHKGNITKLLTSVKYLISSSEDGTIQYRDKETGELIKILSEHTSSVNTMVMDENNLISGSDDGTIKVWNLKTGKLISTLKNAHNAGISALMITDDYIISGGKDKKISIWKYYE